MATLTRITSSPTLTFSPSERCFEAGCIIHQQDSPANILITNLSLVKLNELYQCLFLVAQHQMIIYQMMNMLINKIETINKLNYPLFPSVYCRKNFTMLPKTCLSCTAWPYSNVLCPPPPLCNTKVLKTLVNLLFVMLFCYQLFRLISYHTDKHTRRQCWIMKTTVKHKLQMYRQCIKQK